jgi:xylan 1,4-beta-xylosidase
LERKAGLKSVAMKSLRKSLLSCLALASFSPALALRGQPSNAPVSFPVTIQVDASRQQGPLKPIWRFFGADEPNYATMKDGRKLLAELGAIGKRRSYFRTHNLLNSGDGTPAFKWGSTDVYTEDSHGRPVYHWEVVDRIFRAYLENGVHPYAEIGFMPEALSRKPQPYRHQWRPGLPYNEIIAGWAYPPKNYAKWGELVYQWASHCADTFGREEVAQWYWETWNEPNIAYWQGSPAEFYQLHDYAVDGVRRALATARVGGPDAAAGGGQWMRDFLQHCLHGTNYATGRIGTPLDFVAFHAKGAPTYVDGHVRMGIARQLQEIETGFAVVASFPELKDTPIIIGESDPEGCAACQGPQLAYRNGAMYSSYTAAVFARKAELAAKHGVNLEGALTWAFEFEDQPYFAGFRALASCGIDLPVLNVFRMFSRMGGERLAANSSGAAPLDRIVRESVRGDPDVAAVAGLEPGRLTVLVWHYHDDDVRGPDADVELRITGLPVQEAESRLTHYRVDDGHSNAYAEWKRMGSPAAPDREQYDRLLAAGQLAVLEAAPPMVIVRHGIATLKFQLPRQAVSLLVLEWG